MATQNMRIRRSAASRIPRLWLVGTAALTACGGGSGGGGAGPTYTASGGGAQKGPVIQGSTVTAQQLNASLSPTGMQFTYQVTSKFGNFSPTSTLTSQYLGLDASGYYFDEVQNGVSSEQITLNAYRDLGASAVLNVNRDIAREWCRSHDWRRRCLPDDYSVGIVLVTAANGLHFDN
jgi:hypothetical protein